MRVRTLLASMAFVAVASAPLAAEQLVRVNEAGYFPNARKNLVILSDADLAGNNWDIIDISGASVLSGKVSSAKTGISDFSPKPFNYRVDFSSLSKEGEFLFRVGELEKKIRVDVNPYGDIITSSIRWLRSQRSGTNKTIDRVPAHFGDSSCAVFRKKDANSNSWENWVEDAEGEILDLQGGWYAGGNYAKFTSATAYTTYYLLRAYETNPAIFEKVNSTSAMVDVLDEAAFGLSYLMKVMPNDNDFIIQVGGFDSENGVRLPNEDAFEGKRECFSAFSHPQMGFTVAALALGAKVFEKEGRTAEAAEYKAMAEKIFTKAMSANYSPVWIEKDYEQFKDDSRYDNLLIGAMELFNLTNNPKYKEKAKEFSNKAKAAYWAGWNMQNMMAHSLIAKDYSTSMNFFKDDLNNFAGTARNPKNIWGFPMEPAFTSLYLGLGIGIGSARYYEVTGDNKYSDVIMNVLDYGFGVNNWGVSFTASPKLKNSVKNFNMAIYKLQTHLFPEGAVALGPCDKGGHDAESKWILDDVRVNYCYPHNTEKIVFLDHEDDYMTMDSWIFGAADNIYFLALASTIYGK